MPDAAVCIYCGTAPDVITADHVPPRNLFPSPRPADLITVPACSPCNKSYEKDDEYFRFAMTAPTPLTPGSAAERAWREGVIGGTLHRSPALKSTIIRGLTQMEIFSPAGLYLGHMPTVQLNRGRVDRVATRIVRALHWRHYGAVPSKGVKFSTAAGPDPKKPGVLEKVAVDLLRGRAWQGVGNGEVFRYRYDRVLDRPDWGAWCLLFYSATFVLVLLSREDEVKEEAP